MVFSTKYSQYALRICLAAVFFWFGVDKFFHPAYWLDAWVPAWTVALATTLGGSGTQFVYLNGVFEMLIGLSLISGVFMRFFSLLGILFLAGIMIFSGFSEVLVRDIGLVGALVALFLWPERS